MRRVGLGQDISQIVDKHPNLNRTQIITDLHYV